MLRYHAEGINSLPYFYASGEEDKMILLQQMLALFALMLIGFFMGKKDVLDKATTKKISWIVINVANVSLILQAGLDNKNEIAPTKLLLVGGIAVGMYVVLMLLAILLPILLRIERKNYGIYRTMLIFSNIGFMGIPLLRAIAGSEAVLYAALFQFPFNILLYTYGIAAIQQTEDLEPSAKKGGFRWKSMLNVGVLACVFALIFFFGKVDMPNFVDTVLLNLSNLTAPLSMLVIGQSFTEFQLKDLFTDSKLVLFAAIKLLVIPIAGLFLLQQFIADGTILTVCLVMLGTPVASMTAMLAQQYDSNYELASKGVALTTILSVVTIPLVSAIMGL